MTFKILHAPLHGNSATNAEIGRALKRPGVVGVVFTEAYKHGPFLKSRPRWRATTGSTRRNSRGTMVARDIAVMARRWRKPISRGVRRGSRASTPLPIAPERFVTYSLDMLRGRPLLLIGLHPNAAVRHAWGTDRAEKYRDNMKECYELVEQMREEHGEDLDVVITGDLQYTAADPVRDWSPRDLFRRLGMDDWVAAGLDWVAVGGGLNIVDWTTIRDNGQDHPWIEVEVDRVG